MQCSAVQCNAVLYSAVQSSALCAPALDEQGSGREQTVQRQHIESTLRYCIILNYTVLYYMGILH